MREHHSLPPPMARPAPTGWLSNQKGPIIASAIGVVAMILVGAGIFGIFVTFERERAKHAAMHAAEIRRIEIDNERKRLLARTGITEAEYDELMGKHDAAKSIAAGRLVEAKLLLEIADNRHEPNARVKAVTLLRSIVSEYPDAPAANQARKMLELLE